MRLAREEVLTKMAGDTRGARQAAEVGGVLEISCE